MKPNHLKENLLLFSSRTRIIQHFPHFPHLVPEGLQLRLQHHQSLLSLCATRLALIELLAKTLCIVKRLRVPHYKVIVLDLDTTIRISAVCELAVDVGYFSCEALDLCLKLMVYCDSYLQKFN